MHCINVSAEIWNVSICQSITLYRLLNKAAYLLLLKKTSANIYYLSIYIYIEIYIYIYIYAHTHTHTYTKMPPINRNTKFVKYEDDNHYL